MIESEKEAAASTAVAATTNTAAATARNAQRGGWWSRMMGQSWELSLPQVAMAVSLIVVVVALATVFGVRRVQSVASTPLTASSGNPTSGRNAALSTSDVKFLVDGRVQQQQAAIQYWNQRVEQRKARWSPQMREAFERNMSVIDQAVNDSREQLMQNPHDEISEEMLNAALTDKMELLKEFSDQ